MQGYHILAAPAFVCYTLGSSHLPDSWVCVCVSSTTSPFGEGTKGSLHDHCPHSQHSLLPMMALSSALMALGPARL